MVSAHLCLKYLATLFSCPTPYSSSVCSSKPDHVSSCSKLRPLNPKPNLTESIKIAALFEPTLANASSDKYQVFVVVFLKWFGDGNLDPYMIGLAICGNVPPFILPLFIEIDPTYDESDMNLAQAL
jgi:hypothetical protein